MAIEQTGVVFKSFLDFTLAVEFLCGTTANCLILYVFYRKPGLLTLPNRFVVNLTIINIITCLSLLPLSITHNSYLPVSVVIPYLCCISEFASYFCSSVIPFAVLLIAIDQYFAVVDPLHYHAVINNHRSACMIAASWLLSLVLAACGVIHFELSDHRRSMFSVCSSGDENFSIIPSDETAAGDWLALLFSFIFVAVSFALPFSLICYIYSRICAAASGNAKRTQPDLGHMPLRESALSCTDSSKVTERDESEEWDDEDVGLQMCAKPSLVLTRPSPPRVEVESPRRTYKSVLDLCAKEQLVINEQLVLVNRSLPNLKVSKSVENDLTLLKPFLPRNTSFCAPTTPIVATPQRRHSNVPIPRVSSDVLPKPGPLYKQSSAGSSSRSSSSRIPVSRASSIRSTSSYLVNNLRHRLSNAGLFRYRDRARVARVSALVIVMGLTCWLPFFVVHLLQAGIEFSGFDTLNIPQIVNSSALVLLLVSTVASPGLFALRNRKIRKEIRNIFKLSTNDLRTCSGDFTRQHFFARFKAQLVQLVAKVKPVNNEKNLATGVPTQTKG